MEYAIEMLIPVLMGLYVGMWMTDHWGAPSMVTPGLAILGMVAGIAIMARRVKRMQGNLPKPDPQKIKPIKDNEPIADSPWDPWDDEAKQSDDEENKP